MEDQKKTESSSKDDSQKKDYNCCAGNFNEMFAKMQDLCGSNEKSFDCCAMMRNMSGETSKEPQK